MNVEYIVNQDRDNIIEIGDHSTLFVIPAIHNGKVIGHNIMTTICLGTYDSQEEALEILDAICESDEEIYNIP